MNRPISAWLLLGPLLAAAAAGGCAVRTPIRPDVAAKCFLPRNARALFVVRPAVGDLARQAGAVALLSEMLFKDNLGVGLEELGLPLDGIEELRFATNLDPANPGWSVALLFRAADPPSRAGVRKALESRMVGAGPAGFEMLRGLLRGFEILRVQNGAAAGCLVFFVDPRLIVVGSETTVDGGLENVLRRKIPPGLDRLEPPLGENVVAAGRVLDLLGILPILKSLAPGVEVTTDSTSVSELRLVTPGGDVGAWAVEADLKMQIALSASSLADFLTKLLLHPASEKNDPDRVPESLKLTCNIEATLDAKSCRAHLRCEFDSIRAIQQLWDLKRAPEPWPWQGDLPPINLEAPPEGRAPALKEVSE